MSAVFPGFKRGITIALFQESGTNSLRYIMLKRWRRYFLFGGERFVRMALCTSSKPVALLFLSLERALSNSDGVNMELRSFGERFWMWD